MITIRHEAEGCKMKFSNPGSGMRGFSVHARSVAEVHAALDHYLGVGGGTRRQGHVNNTLAESCPLCRKG